MAGRQCRRGKCATWQSTTLTQLEPSLSPDPFPPLPSPPPALPAHLDANKVDGQVARQQRYDKGGEGHAHNGAHKVDHPAAAADTIDKEPSGG